MYMGIGCRQDHSCNWTAHECGAGCVANVKYKTNAWLWILLSKQVGCLRTLQSCVCSANEAPFGTAACVWGLQQVAEPLGGGLGWAQDCACLCKTGSSVLLAPNRATACMHMGMRAVAGLTLLCIANTGLCSSDTWIIFGCKSAANLISLYLDWQLGRLCSSADYGSRCVCKKTGYCLPAAVQRRFTPHWWGHTGVW